MCPAEAELILIVPADPHNHLNAVAKLVSEEFAGGQYQDIFR